MDKIGISNGKMGKITLENLSKDGQKALVLGIGGGGDIVGTIPTARYLEEYDVETIKGGITWERSVKDSSPGPRKIEELDNCDPITDTTAMANPKTKTEDGLKLTESSVSEVLGEKTFLLDLNKGVSGAVRGLEEATEKLDIDFVVGVDVGGDVLGKGDEEGLQSMLSDSMTLSSLREMDSPSVLGVLGLGADGELSLDDLMKNSAEIAASDGFLGARGVHPSDFEVMREAADKTATECSELALNAARGEHGDVEIREGEREVSVSLLTAVTFYFEPETVAEEINNSALKISDTESIYEAHEILAEEGIPTELKYERSIKNKRTDGERERDER